MSQDQNNNKNNNDDLEIQNTQKLKEQHQNTIRELPILPSNDIVLFPHMVVPWIVEPPGLVRMIDDALAADRTIVVVSVDEPLDSEDELPKKLNQKIGTMGLILRMAKNEQGHARLVVQGITRVRIKEITATKPYIKAKVEAVQDKVHPSLALEAMVANIRQAFSKILDLSPNLPGELRSIIVNIDDPGVLADIVISHLNVSPAQKQEILAELDVTKRLEKALKILSEQLEILELGHKIQSQVRDQVDKSQREYFLREQLKAIKRELGESEEQPDEIEELREKLKAKDLPEEARKEAERELERLSRMHPSSSEYTVARTYLDWILELPWNESTQDNLDLDRAEKILNQDHYDLEKIKKRIIEYLAVRKLKPDAKGPILCFAGPPGTGKTSLGKSIAKAIGRKFHRIALGGVRDEAEIRGHRRTYIGAMPGRIIQGLRKVGVNNPVIMLDEIDKIGTDFRGDPASALLEVLDPEQNSKFTDHYLGVEFDLSKIIFIATANVLETIPAPLLDRMEILELSGYTLEDKIEIAKRYLIPRQLDAHGLTKKNLTIEKRALVKIISEYTREAGVRNLERQIGSICRAVARMVAQGHEEKVTVKVKNLPEFLGKPRYLPDVAERTSIPGVATGLAWTPVGGDILFVEATKMPGTGKLTLTGQLGDVMKESAQTALSYVKSKACTFGIPEELFKTEDIHVHVPAGAIPKDGPSAGITIVMALISLLTDKPVRPDVAMTGEITLRGLVLPVGGIKEKVLAAHRAGIKEVILPKRNNVDLDELPEQIRNQLKFHLVSKVDQASKIAFKKMRKTKPASHHSGCAR